MTCASCVCYRPITAGPRGTCERFYPGRTIDESHSCHRHARFEPRPRKTVPGLGRLFGWLGSMLYPTREQTVTTRKGSGAREAK